jgi:hypothetical protein
MKNKSAMFHKFRGGLGLLILIFCGFSAVVMLLWNALLPDIFGLTTINFWQAAGLLLFCRILFGGIGSKVLAAHNNRKFIQNKWEKMGIEARRKFMENDNHFCNGFWGEKRKENVNPDEKGADE